MKYSVHRVVSLCLTLACCVSIIGSCSANSEVGVTPTSVTTTTTFTAAKTSDLTALTNTTTTTATKKTTIQSTSTQTTETVAETTTKKTTSKTKKTTTTRPASAPTSSRKSYSIQGVPIIHQMPKFPSGCESVSAVMALNYWGEDVSVMQFISKYLPKSNKFYSKSGKKYGPDPNEYFVGDPTKTSAFGCMAPVIEKALTSYFGSGERVHNTTGVSLSQLCADYIDQDMPVLLWVTIGMIDTKASDEWFLEDGSLFEWPENEHCMVLVGYDQTYYYFNDPYRGTVKKYAKWLVEKRYQELGKQSLVITG